MHENTVKIDTFVTTILYSHHCKVDEPYMYSFKIKLIHFQITKFSIFIAIQSIKSIIKLCSSNTTGKSIIIQFQMKIVDLGFYKILIEKIKQKKEQKLFPGDGLIKNTSMLVRHRNL